MQEPHSNLTEIKLKGLYIHIPFCNQKCPYCDFFSILGRPISFEEYLNAVLKEIELYRDIYNFDLQTVYLGGGTPSVVPPKLYDTFFSELSKIVDLSKVEEITIEVNPESYSKEDFKQLLEIGVNRISIGVQSFLEKNLKVLGRKHTVKDSLRTIENASKVGFENISVDLIWGLPKQTKEDLQEEFKILKDLPVVHLSAYLLTVYEETPLSQLVEKGIFKLPSEERIEELYYTLLEETEKLHFERYEISNFSKGGNYRSKHNLLYWRSEPFLGVGAGAWSFDGTKRWSNLKNLTRYVELLKRDALPVERMIELNERELFKEKLIMALRTTEGVPKEWIEKKLPPEVVKEYFRPTEGGKNLAFNEKGFLVSNFLLAELID